MIVSAIEPSIPHAEMSRIKGFDVTTGFFPEDVSAPDKFDFIVFNDVFEHLPDPKAALTRCEALLAPGGVLVLNLPSNHGLIYRLASLLARNGQLTLLERLWQKDFPSPHLSYFNPDVLQRFVDRYSRLRHIDTFYLDTFIAEGLEARIKATHDGIIGSFIYMGLRVILPVIRLFPADIIVGVFEKPS
jgi:SAM-dependent methyltransferase